MLPQTEYRCCDITTEELHPKTCTVFISTKPSLELWL